MVCLNSHSRSIGISGFAARWVSVLRNSLLLFLCLMAGVVHLPHSRAATPETEAFTERRDFRGFVRRDMAEHAARLAAELAAFSHAARIVAREPDLQFANKPGSHGLPAAASPEGLARTMYGTRISAVGVEGFPPNMRALVSVVLQPPDKPREALRAALVNPGRLEVYARIVDAQRALLARYDAHVPELLSRRPQEDGGREESHILQSIVNEMTALEMLAELLPLYGEHWTMPEKVQSELVKAEALAPDNPLVLTALAEAQLQLDRPLVALEHVSRALNHTSEFARAHDVKGAILLRQRLPALAAESFSKAVSLAPKNSAYLMHRASAYLVQEEYAAMCADFQSACSLGECEGLQWARGVGRCLPEGGR